MHISASLKIYPSIETSDSGTNPDHNLFEGANAIHTLLFNFIVSAGEYGADILSPAGQNWFSIKSVA